METDDVSDTIRAIRQDVVNALINTCIPPGSLDEQWDIEGLEETLNKEFGMEMPVGKWLEQDDALHEETLRARILETMEAAYAEKEQQAGPEVIRHFEKAVMLQVLDASWKEHLAAMDYLRQGIGLRGYGQKDPKQEYKREAFEMFTSMLDRIKHDLIGIVSRVKVRAESDVEAVEQQRRSQAPRQYRHAEASAMEGEGQADAAGQTDNAGQAPFIRKGRKIGRNEPCPCGSGKKYKQCHGKLT
jgi:preprotein translocase subunit SecA